MTKKSMDSVKKTVQWSSSCKKPEVSKSSRSLLGFFLFTPYNVGRVVLYNIRVSHLYVLVLNI